MTRPVRVLVVDDSVVVRRVVGRALEADPAFELAGAARDGADALTKAASTQPDVIVLDLEMPLVDGFEVLRRLRDAGSTTPVVVFSHLGRPGAAATLDALELGAVDFVLKPTAAQGIDLADDYVVHELLPRLAALGGDRSAAPEPAPAKPAARDRVSGADAVVVAVSTGGPNALAELVAGLPAGLPVPVLVVQHMPPEFTKQLAGRLHRIGTLHVDEAVDGEPVRPGHVYVAPGGRHMAVERRGPDVYIALNDDPPENSCRPAGDVLFRSAAAAYGARLLAVVMTGMGRDGRHGSEAVRDAGGSVIAQDAATSVVAGMPGAVADIAEARIPLHDLAAEIARRTAR